MANQEPYLSTWFAIEFQGQIVGAFHECAGLSSEHEVVEWRASGPQGEQLIRKIPGRIRWGNIVLRRGVTAAVDLWEWRKLVERGELDIARRNGSIVLFNARRDEVGRWDIFNAWPCRISGPSLNATTDEVAVEELELTHEGIMRVR
jgi:phage tail-like protein